MANIHCSLEITMPENCGNILILRGGQPILEPSISRLTASISASMLSSSKERRTAFKFLVGRQCGSTEGCHLV